MNQWSVKIEGQKNQLLLKGKCLGEMQKRERWPPNKEKDIGNVKIAMSLFMFVFEQVGQRKPMHLGSTYLIPSKPKDFPIHFMCTYICIYVIYTYTEICLYCTLMFVWRKLSICR